MFHKLALRLTSFSGNKLAQEENICHAMNYIYMAMAMATAGYNCTTASSPPLPTRFDRGVRVHHFSKKKGDHRCGCKKNILIGVVCPGGRLSNSGPNYITTGSYI